MKKIGIAALVVLLAYAPVATQNTWFKIHDLGFHHEEPALMIPTGNDFIVLTFSYNSDFPVTRNEVICFDSLGEIKWRSLIKYPQTANSDFIYYHSRSLAIAQDLSIYATSTSPNDAGDDEILVNKFNKDGALVWHKTYGIPGRSIDPGYHGAIEFSEDSLGLIMTGTDWLVSGKLIVCKIDSAGQQEFIKIVDVPVMGIVGVHKPIVRMPDNSYKIAYDNNVLLDFRDYLVSLSATGDLQHAFVNPLTGRAHDLKLHPNGNLVYLSHERNPPMFEWGGLRVQMLTPEFDTLWSRLYYDTEIPYVINQNSFIRNLSIAPDGRILAMAYSAKNCVLVCYDPEGTLLWARDVALEEFSGRKFHYCSWAADGGILVNGYLSGTVNGQYDSQMFLFKLDSMGCLVPGCQQTIITDTKERKEIDKLFEVSPNPTNRDITIRYLGKDNQDLSGLAVYIYDTYGKLIFNGRFDGNTAILELGNLQNGMYFLRISDMKGKTYTSKIIKI